VDGFLPFPFQALINEARQSGTGHLFISKAIRIVTTLHGSHIFVRAEVGDTKLTIAAAHFQEVDGVLRYLEETLPVEAPSCRYRRENSGVVGRRKAAGCV